MAPSGNGKPTAYKPPFQISRFASWVGSCAISIWIWENVSLSGLIGTQVSIRRISDGVLLMPVKASTWPDGFFESIRIDDANFTRPEQGELHLSRNSPDDLPARYDLQLCGQALALDLTLVTHNTREFQRVTGLRLEDWETEGAQP